MVHFTHLLPWAAEIFSNTGVIADSSLSPILKLFPNLLSINDDPVVVTALICSALGAAALLTIGKSDRAAALWILFCLACLLGRNPLISNPSMPYVGWMLLAHSCIAGAPYGSWSARNRNDPVGEWHFSPQVFTAAWIVLALSYSYSGYTKLLSPSWVAGDTVGFVLENPLARLSPIRDLFLFLPDVFLKAVTWTVLYVELLFAPLSLISRARPVLWLAMLFVQFGFLFLLNFADLTFGMLLFHLFTFDPRWIKGRHGADTDELYFDGSCALCNNCVRFLISEDTPKKIRFSPLEGASFSRLRAERNLSYLPDSIVVRQENGVLLIKSDAVVHLLCRLGGLWTLMGVAYSCVPKGVRDVFYDFIGARRYAWFGKTPDACPIIPAAHRGRFFE
jgi:predicted DCC family thiol-disulfide oxidoreductase YuxK